MGATRAKTEYLHRRRLEQFLERHLPHVWLATFTFQENITDKREAMHRWKPVADWLRRHGVDHVGVWQQQKRGAWHHHVLVNRYLNVVGLRAFCVARGWGSFLNIERVGQGSRRFAAPGRVVQYLTRYLTRDFCDHVPRRVRLTSGRASNKVGTTRFQWVNGLAKVWRTGCTLLGRQPAWGDDRDQRRVWLLGCERLGLDYAEVRWRLVMGTAWRSSAPG
ncbi:hypothetical protein HQ590_15235 [bacterium]|nr:hypothetical protein [bacterium]